MIHYPQACPRRHKEDHARVIGSQALQGESLAQDSTKHGLEGQHHHLCISGP